MDKRLIITTETKNPEWGFFGTLKTNYGYSDKEAEKLFDYACTSISIRHDLDKGLIRDFLDAREGRHFADDLSFYGVCEGSKLLTTMNAIDSAWLESNWLKSLKRYMSEIE